MMGGSLLDHHQHALDTLVSTIDETTIDVDELNGWLGAVEVLRLLLGTQLDVSEDFTEIDPGDPRVDQFTVYQYLSMLQNEIVDTLADGAAPGRAPSCVTPRLLTIMGSGETAPTMVKVHRSVVERLGPDAGPGLLLDTPFGFQTNASEIASRAVTYFRDSVGAEHRGRRPASVDGSRRPRR